MNSTQDPLNSAIPMKIWIVKEVMGSVHNARDPLTDTPTGNAHVNKNKNKKRKTQTQHRGRQSKRMLDSLYYNTM